MCTGFGFTMQFPPFFVMTAFLFYCEIRILVWHCCYSFVMDLCVLWGRKDGFLSFFHGKNSCLTTCYPAECYFPASFFQAFFSFSWLMFFCKLCRSILRLCHLPAVWPVISPPFCCHLGQFLFTILIDGYMHLLLQLLAFGQLVQTVEFPLPQGLGMWLCSSLGLFLR